MKNWLDVLEQIAIITTGASVMGAFISYRYQKKRDKLIDAANQLSFFREKILGETAELARYVWENIDPNYIFDRIRIEKLDLKILRNKEFSKSLKQINLSGKNLIIRLKQESLLNMLEELSIKIKVYDILENKKCLEILSEIKQPFVEIVEQNIAFILFERDAIVGRSAYSELLNLYIKWRDDVEQKTPQERLEEFKKHD